MRNARQYGSSVTGMLWVPVAAVLFAACGDSGADYATNAHPVDASVPEAKADVAVEGAVEAAADVAEAAPPCKPKTCAELGASCGNAPDGCGGKVTCGTCSSGQFCGGGGLNKCGINACAPKSCAQVSASCGLASNGCSDVIDCGECPAPQTCGGGAAKNQCGCVPKTCAQLGATCGSAPDGCGGIVECGTCETGQTCGGGGTNQCGAGTCATKSCAQLGASCGVASDLCGGVIDCGKCSAPDVCGGSGKVNQCGCMPKTCAQLGASCGGDRRRLRQDPAVRRVYGPADVRRRGCGAPVRHAVPRWRGMHAGRHRFSGVRQWRHADPLLRPDLRVGGLGDVRRQRVLAWRCGLRGVRQLRHADPELQRGLHMGRLERVRPGRMRAWRHRFGPLRQLRQQDAHLQQLLHVGLFRELRRRGRVRARCD